MMRVCREQYQHGWGRDLAGHFSIVSIDSISSRTAASQQSACSSLIRTHVVLSGREKGKRKTNKSAKGGRGNIRKYETKM